METNSTIVSQEIAQALAALVANHGGLAVREAVTAALIEAMEDEAFHEAEFGAILVDELKLDPDA